MIGSSSKLIVVGLDAAYGRAQVLYDVALDVGAGEAVALVGRNGAGKSTTLRSILGLIANCTGEIIFDNAPISHLPAYERVQRGLGYVPEDRRIFADLTVDENLEVGRQAPAPRRAAMDSRPAVRNLSKFERAALPARRAHIWRRAADAGHSANLDGQPVTRPA